MELKGYMPSVTLGLNTPDINSSPQNFGKFSEGSDMFQFSLSPPYNPQFFVVFLLCFCFFCCVGFGFFSFSWGGKAPKGVLPSICKLLGRISKVLSAHCIPSAVKLYCFHSNQ